MVTTYHLFYGEKYDQILGFYTPGILCVSSEVTLWVFTYSDGDEVFDKHCSLNNKNLLNNIIKPFKFYWMQTICSDNVNDVWNKCLDYANTLVPAMDTAYSLKRELTPKEFLKLVEMKAFL